MRESWKNIESTWAYNERNGEKNQWQSNDYNRKKQNKNARKQEWNLKRENTGNKTDGKNHKNK